MRGVSCRYLVPLEENSVRVKNRGIVHMSNFYPAKEIIPGLWIGSIQDGASKAFAKKNNIRFIIHATDADDMKMNDSIPSYRVPVHDSPDDACKMFKYLPITSLLINEQMRYGRHVLSRCFAGQNRSSTIVAGYLMFSRGMTADEAMAYIRSKKPETFQPMNFLPALRSWETKLRAAGKIPENRFVATA